jgi:lanosterol synthase
MQFALESLSLVGETYSTSHYSRKACEFLLRHQREDGGWGESYKVKYFRVPVIR